MLHTRGGEHLDGWLDQVERSGLPELQSFAMGVKKDKDAVKAGLTWWINNGMGDRTRDQAQIDQKTGLWSGGLSTARENVSFMRCRKNKPSKVIVWVQRTIRDAVHPKDKSLEDVLGSIGSRGCMAFVLQNTVDPPICHLFEASLPCRFLLTFPLIPFLAK